ncbi:hypothetical protein GCM10007874_37520 [Labrys miyagiensis]|uniref:NitT/TauT family transport system substrate-binding protein n=1 Tax=Labrys miyagiensis TaxID=346912 RepID=A0ABQ6CKN7_9HYPH|nr:ABC transporter substrate-binding protein [Labrys miyagiensis]GLS20735.1 hypothetical protein GCM10007874_37520 [Labrys miyagiensis]
MSIITRRQTLKIAAAATATGALFMTGWPKRATAAATDKLIFGTVPYISSGPLFIAQAKGYFEKVGIDLDARYFVDGGLAMPALAAGEIDISVTPCNVGFYNMVAKGTPVRVFMDRGREAAGRGSQAILVSNKLYAGGFHNLDGFKDGTGKTISEAVPGSVGHYLFSKAFKRAGLTSDVAEWKWGLDASSALKLMVAGNLDMVEVSMPGALAAERKGAGHIIAWGDEISPDMQLATMSANETLLNERKDVVVRFCMVMLQAYREFMAAADSGDAEIVKILAKATELPEALIDAARPRWSAMALDGLPGKQAILAQQAFWHEEVKLLERTADADKLFDLTAVTEAKARLADKNPFI